MTTPGATRAAARAASRSRRDRRARASDPGGAGRAVAADRAGARVRARGRGRARRSRPRCEREFGTRSFVAELATALVAARAHRRRPGRRRGTARRHPATLGALAERGRSAFPSCARSSRPSPGCPPTPPPHSKRPRSSGHRSRPTPPCAVGSGPCGNGCTPNRSTPDTAPRCWTGGSCSNPRPTGWPGSASTSTAERALAIKDRLDRLADTPDRAGADARFTGARPASPHATRPRCRRRPAPDRCPQPCRRRTGRR